MELNRKLPGDAFEVELTSIRMRMRQQAREIISQVFMSEEETRALLESQITQAVSQIDWAVIVRKELTTQVTLEARKLVESIATQTMWDREVLKLIKGRLIKALKSENDE